MTETQFQPTFQLRSLLPPSIIGNPNRAAFELVRAVLIRSTYIPGVRHRLGWCGIHEDVTPGIRPGSITARINDRPGVFALSPVDPAPKFGSCFSLAYFPAPDEEIIEAFSVEAGIQALKPDFMDRVRQFGRHPELMALFHLGFIECAKTEQGIFLAFQAKERLGWISGEGIQIRTQAGPIQAVPPGGIDQNLPAFETGMAFFSPLAASFTYTLGTAPSIFYSQRRKTGKALPSAPEIHEHRRTIGYFSTGETAGTIDWEHTAIDIVWEPGKPIPESYEKEFWWRPHLAGSANSLDKKSMGIHDKPRFIVLTGFLGTGKTSFLDHFIQAQTAASSFVAVVQNEIGEKGLDAALLDQTYAVTQMDEGCVCCSLSGNLRAALTDILGRFQPDFIVLETTGLANPANLLKEIDELDDLFEFCSITTIVDSREGVRTLERFEVARDQVRLADVILLNKCDLCISGLGRLKEKIQHLNPVADIHQTIHGDIHPGILYGVNFRKTAKPSPFHTFSNGATHEEDRIETRLINLEKPLNKEALEEMIRAGGNQILRVKGIVEFTDQPGPLVFQYAPGTWHVSKHTGKETRERFLVVIGQDLDTCLDHKFFVSSSAAAR